jgi:hypothetical protein
MTQSSWLAIAAALALVLLLVVLTEAVPVFRP